MEGIWCSDIYIDQGSIQRSQLSFVWKIAERFIIIWDHMTNLVQTSSEATRPWYSSPLIDGRDSFRH